MEKRLQETAKRHMPKDQRLAHAIAAVISGGAIGGSGEVLLMLYQESLHMPKQQALSLVIVTIIALAAILTGLGLFDQLAQRFGAGVFIPITGFANALASSALEGKSEGLIYGIGMNMFKLAGSVLTYGIVSAYFIGMLRYLFLGGAS